MIRPMWVILAVLLSPTVAAINLIDGEGFVYDVGANGVLVNGSLNAYQNMYNLRVNNSNYVGEIEKLNAQGRQVITTTYLEPNSGLQIKRRIYVAEHYNFARYMEILHNPSAEPVQVDVEIYGDLGAGARNNLWHSQAQFLITNDQANIGMPTLLHYHSQVANPIQAEHQLIANKLNWVYKAITVPPNSTVRLLYFVAQSREPEHARQLALQFPGNPTAFYEAILPHELAELINFYPPATTRPNFANIIFLNPNEVRTGFNLQGAEQISSHRGNIPAQYFSFDATEGQNLALRMTANFDAYLYLFDAEGKLLASNDNARANTTNAEILFTAPNTARFYLEATAHDQRKSLNYGQYSIELTTPVPNRRPQAYGFKIDYLQSTLPVKLLLTAFAEDKDGEIIEYCWHFDDNTVPQCSSENTIEHIYQQAGHYNISLNVSDAQAAMDSHTQNIALSALTPDGVIFPINTKINSELSTDNIRSQTRINAYANRYIIKSPPVGQELIIEMRSTALDSFLYLYDNYGRQLRFDDNSGGGLNAQLRYTPLYASDYIIEATSFHDNALGTYELSLHSVTEDLNFHIPIEAAADLNNGLKNTFVARVPQSFGAKFFLWRFGDGEEFAGTDNAIVKHTFRRAGNYQVSLEVHNEQNIVRGQAEFSISNQVALPQAKFTVTPLFGEVPLRTFFNNDSQAAYFNDNLTYLWQFGDGRVATGLQPIHTYRREGVYTVILRAYSSLTALHSAYTIPITVIDRNSSFVPITGITRQRPQVLMAGFDPILQDVLDTEATIFAIVRAGDNPIQSVYLLQNNTEFKLAMQHVATYANGDQHYASILTFPRGSQTEQFDNLFGSKAGQFQIRAVDQASQFHAYPNLEISQHSNISNQNQNQNHVLRIEPPKHVGVKRLQPQVLAAGFDPILIDRQDGEMQIIAIVRPGLYPIHRVELQLHGANEFNLPMRRSGVLPNGDKIYTSTYTYPQLSVGVMTISDWFGFGAGQFSVQVTDQAQNSHSFPRYRVGNYSPR
jgi:PKD repeat protein